MELSGLKLEWWLEVLHRLSGWAGQQTHEQMGS